MFVTDNKNPLSQAIENNLKTTTGASLMSGKLSLEELLKKKPGSATVWHNAMVNRKKRLQSAGTSGVQMALFTVPPPPVPIRWDIQWRWNKKRLLVRIQERYPDDIYQETLDELDAFAGENPWQRHRNPKYHSINNVT